MSNENEPVIFETLKVALYYDKEGNISLRDHSNHSKIYDPDTINNYFLIICYLTGTIRNNINEISSNQLLGCQRYHVIRNDYKTMILLNDPSYRIRDIYYFDNSANFVDINNGRSIVSKIQDLNMPCIIGANLGETGDLKKTCENYNLQHIPFDRNYGTRYYLLKAYNTKGAKH